MTKKKLLRIVLIVAAAAAAAAVAVYLLWWNVFLPITARNNAPAGSLLEAILSRRVDLEKQTEVLKSEGYKDNYFMAEVIEVTVWAEKLDIEMHLGDSDDSHAVDKKTVTVQCPQDKTTDFGTLTAGINLLEEVEVGDIIWAYCLDENCSSIGKECILVKNE